MLVETSDMIPSMYRKQSDCWEWRRYWLQRVGGGLNDGDVLSDCGRDVMTEFVQIKYTLKGGIFYCMKMYTLIFLMERKREWVDSSMKEK